MEIRDLRLLSDDKIICTFTIYIPEWKLSLLACMKRGKKPGSEFITPFAKSFETSEGLKWQSHWEFGKDQQERLIEKVKPMLKEALNREPIESASYGTQEHIPL